MVSIYQELQGVASELLTEFDQGGIYYIAVTPGTGPAQNPGPGVETPYKVDGTARGVSFKYIDNKNVVASDLQITMAVDARYTPNEKGFALINGVRHKVVQAHRKPSAGIPVAWTIVVRK
jgi:hypothetical protein